ncbi:helix-turn-helix domain-containing protein [Photobacterium sp. WH77]|uniref:Helix-turn-helix domain-containing protein n=1 Tax=Photobacterium arenosum TaxID=2774143 RepID=A0ABR9BSN4_9GAMM|nr:MULTISPECIES: helix-turn-helix domain-containing protein [Photobacterium]MBD8514657.1 helix-turn-helix domain-containing protein [Photobacterium arenosum]MBV7262643.1 helix-turn-helix domain-containing protein [Photobacterium sp. WH24]MCG2839073.1 helix-turn-helix domain-containing protein [Photobacterium sp. WH77]MCG2846690.1 helix-turn-helix domain-containing protein [Photobacterium sp. WH80]
MVEPSKPLRITALLLNNVPSTAITGPAEMLMIAAKLAGLPKPEVHYISPYDTHIQTFAGLTIAFPTPWQQVDKTDIFLLGCCGEPSDETYLLPETIKTWLTQQLVDSQYVVSLCTGTFLLAELGLLNHRSATTHWAHVAYFRERYPSVKLMPHLKITHESPFICSSSVRDYYDATLLIIDDLFGSEHRTRCERYIGGDISCMTRICLTSFGQYRQHNDTLIHELQDWMHHEHPGNLTVARCASKSFLSEKQMTRRFKAATGDVPVNYIQRLRLSYARDKLSTTKLNIETISRQVGYSNINHFRLLFKKFYEMTPTQYRKVTQSYCEHKPAH